MLDWTSYEDRYAVDDDDKMQSFEARTDKGTYSVFDPSGEGVYEVFFADASREKRFGSDACKVKIGTFADLDGAKRLAQEHEARSKQTIHAESR